MAAAPGVVELELGAGARVSVEAAGCLGGADRPQSLSQLRGATIVDVCEANNRIEIRVSMGARGGAKREQGEDDGVEAKLPSLNRGVGMVPMTAEEIEGEALDEKRSLCWSETEKNLFSHLIRSFVCSF